MSEVFTPGQASKITGIPGSSLRRYVQVFSDHLSPSANRKRGREFTERDILVIVQIRDLFKEGNSQDDVISKMGDIADEIPEEIQPNDETPPTALMVINRISERQESQQEQINALRDQLLTLADELEQERNKSLWRKLRPW